MKLRSFLSKLIDRYFNFDDDRDLDEVINVIIDGLKNLEDSNVVCSNSNVVRQLNLIGKDRGLVFFDWDISLMRKLYYLIIHRYPRIVNISIKNNMIQLRVNDTKQLYHGEPTDKFKINNKLPERLEIDISDNFIKFVLKEKES